MLTVVDQLSRESPLIEVDFSLTGHKVAAALDRRLADGSVPTSLTVLQRHLGLELRRMDTSHRHLHGKQSAQATDDFYHLSTCPKIPDPFLDTSASTTRRELTTRFAARPRMRFISRLTG